MAYSAIKQLSLFWNERADVFALTNLLAQRDTETVFSNVQEAAIEVLAKTWVNSPTALETLKNCALNNRNFRGRWRALKEISNFCGIQSEEILVFLLKCAADDPFIPMHDSNRNPRQAAVESIIKCYRDNDYVLPFLLIRAENDLDSRVRGFILSQIGIYWRDNPSVSLFLQKQAVSDPYGLDGSHEIRTLNPRKTALDALLKHYPEQPKTFEILKERVKHDPDEKLRQWAKQKIKGFLE